MKKNRRGVTIAEAVVAMAVIVTVSISAVGLCTRFSLLSGDMINRNLAAQMVENSLECFKYSQNEGEFRSHLWYATGEDFVITDTHYHCVLGKYKVDLFVTFGEISTFTASAVAEGGKTIIYIEKYTKTGEAPALSP